MRKTQTFLTLTFLTLLLAAGWLLCGCDSDETAPNDPLPPLEDGDVAQQSGYMAMAIAEVAPLVLEYGSKADASDGNYSYTFAYGDPIQGVVLLHFELAGAPSGYDVADYAAAYTAADAPLEITAIEGGVPWLLAVDLESDINQGAGTAVVEGTGTLTLGSYVANWTLTALAVEESGDWPASGGMTFTNEGITATVTFDGDDTATVAVGLVSWSLNLNNGVLTEL